MEFRDLGKERLSPEELEKLIGDRDHTEFLNHAKRTLPPQEYEGKSAIPQRSHSDDGSRAKSDSAPGYYRRRPCSAWIRSRGNRPVISSIFSTLSQRCSSEESRLPPIIDIHIHIQPDEMLKPAAHELIRHGRRDYDDIVKYSASPRDFLNFLDRAEIERAGIINYVSPDVIGFTSEVNDWCCEILFC